MESVPEIPGQLHFYKLLYLLSKQNQVGTIQVLVKVPDSLICGFGFERPMFMTMSPAGVRFGSIEERDIPTLLSTLNPYSVSERGPLPAYVLKHSSTRKLLHTCQEASQRWSQIHTRRGKTHPEEAILQAYLITPDQKAQRVRVTWEKGVGVKVEWMTNSDCFLRAKEAGEQGSRKAVRFAGVGGRGEEDIEEGALFPGPFAEVHQCRLSPATSELGFTVEYVKTLLEQAVLIPSGYTISSLKIDLLQDIHRKWYFMAIEEYQISARPPQFSFSQPVSRPTKSISRSSYPSSRISSPVPELSAPLPRLPTRGGSVDSQKRQISERIKPLDRHKKPKNPKIRLKRHISEPNFNQILKQAGPITDQKTWERVQALEKDIASLIDQKGSRPLAFMTYRAWKERGSKLGTGTVDLLYAQKIAEKARIVRKEASKQHRFLADLKERMMAVTGGRTAEEELAVLCEQKRLPPACLEIEQIIKKVVRRKERSRTELKTASRDANAASLLTYAATRMDKLQSRVEALHPKVQTS